MTTVSRDSGFSICIIRRNYRSDGGAEVATSSYIEALSGFADVTLACESWAASDFRGRVERLLVSGRTRSASYRSFIGSAERFISGHQGLSHSHELVPGANIIRLGDGLHVSWLKAAGWSWKAVIDPFHRYKIKIERKTLEDPRLRSVIVNSNLVGRDLRAKFGIDPSSIILIRNIVRSDFKETSIVGPLKSGNKLVFVGSGWHRKGLSLAIRSLTRLPENTTLTVYGVDRTAPKYQKLVSCLGLQSRVTFKGLMSVTPQELDNYDSLVHPAIYEPFPNVAIEALSRGLPVVSSYSSGTSDFDKVHGVVSCELTEEGVAEGVRWALACGPKERMDFRDHIVQFDQAYLRRSLEALYESL